MPAELTGLDVEKASSTPADEVLRLLSTAPSGLTSSEVAARLLKYGANAVRIRRTRAWVVLGRQLKSPLLVLLAVTATASYFVGEQADAIIIGVILLLSVGLGLS